MVKKKRKVKKEEDLKLKHREFWIFFAVVFLLSVLTILNFIGNSDVTGHISYDNSNDGKHIQTIAFLKEGAFHFEVRNIDGVKEARLQLRETVKGGKIIFEEDDGIPFDRNYYSKFKVTTPEKQKYKSIRFLFKIKESDLLNAGISQGDLSLHVNNKELPTTFVQRDGEYLFYRAASSEFGNYVLGKAIPKMVNGKDIEEVDQESEDVEADSLAGQALEQELPEEKADFGGLVLIIVLIIIAVIVITIYLGKRKSKKLKK